MNYRQRLHPSVNHLNNVESTNVSLRGVSLATNVPPTGTPVNDTHRESIEYTHFKLPVINMYTLPPSGTYSYPLQINIKSFYDLDEVYYRTSSDRNWKPYTGSITITEPTSVEYYGIRLTELETTSYISTFGANIGIGVMIVGSTFIVG